MNPDQRWRVAHARQVFIDTLAAAMTLADYDEWSFDHDEELQAMKSVQVAAFDLLAAKG